MRKARDTLCRQLALLLFTPRESQPRTPTILLERLGEEGLSVGLRTLLRHLENLSGLLALQRDTQETPYRWSVARNGPANLAAMDTSKALALFLASIHLKRFLSLIGLIHLNPQFYRGRSYYMGNVSGCPSACPRADRPRVSLAGAWPVRKIRIHAPSSWVGEIQNRVNEMRTLYGAV